MKGVGTQEEAEVEEGRRRGQQDRREEGIKDTVPQTRGWVEKGGGREGFNEGSEEEGGGAIAAEYHVKSKRGEGERGEGGGIVGDKGM